MTGGVVAAAIALLTILLFVVPAWIVIKDLRTGGGDPEAG